jgi:hypothetical protein
MARAHAGEDVNLDGDFNLVIGGKRVASAMHCDTHAPRSGDRVGTVCIFKLALSPGHRAAGILPADRRAYR